MKERNITDIRWEKYFNALKKFREKHPDRWPSQTVKYPRNLSLGRWCYEQNRKYQEKLLKRGQVRLLNSIGFPFKKIVARDTRFEKQLEYLKRFRKKHPDVWPNNLTEYPKGNKLGVWCNNIRVLKGTLPRERVKALNSLGFEWGILQARWDKNYAFVKKYLKKNKHLPPISKYSSAMELRAATWIHNRRTKLKQGLVSKKERIALKKLGIKA